MLLLLCVPQLSTLRVTRYVHPHLYMYKSVQVHCIG